MLVTDAVFHELISSLKVYFVWNRFDMSVMRPVSQFAIGPYVSFAERSSLTHRFTAVWRSALLVNV